MAACQSCGSENPPANRFCADCGRPLTSVCPSCGAPAEAGRRFCGQCGAPLSAAAGPPDALLASPAPVAPLSAPGRPPVGSPVPAETVAERRVCSILFGDLVGFTPLSEARDPEEVRTLLSRYFDIASTIVTRYGGIVEKFIGDAVMAVWGTPSAQEGDTERAVRAGLDLTEAVRALGEELNTPDLMARAGIVTGEVAVTLGANWEGMVAGDAVNTASRVQSVARPGTVFVDEATKRLSEQAITFFDEGAFELKGKELPERLHRAVRVLSGVGGSQRPGGLEAPLTGRDGELRTLKELFHSSVSRRSPYLAVVSGPAGVGKSRLGWELEKYIDGLAETMLWHRGRCLSYGEGVSYWALSEIVRRRFGIAEDETVKAASAKLKEGLVRFVTDDTERDYVGVRLARLLGLEYESRDKVVLTKEELFAGWRLFFERLAGVAPVVMLVEDAQHADESLLSFFEHLIDWTRDLPIFVLLFARPGLSAIDAGYGVGRNRSTLSLDPLSDAAMGELVEALVPGMPAPAREAITSRAQGIPLFAVETVRSLLDQGVVSKEDESYRLTGSLGALKVPDSLHGLLAARLDALTQEVRSLVADASVLGSSFSKDGLVAVSGKDEAAVEAGLSDLVRRDVLQVSADPLSPERGRYRFSQEMLRQVAYETLSRTDRKLRHLGVAAHLRTAFAEDGEEVADAIARHYLDALSAVPSDGDEEEITSKALLFLVRAGERAKSSGALQQAATAFSEAARVAPKSEAASLYEKAAEASHDHGDYEAAISFADSAIECYSDQGDGRGAARARAQRGYALSAVGRITEGRAELEEALEVLSLDPDSDTIEALSHLARLEAVSGNFAEGERLASEGLSLSQGLDAGPVLSAGLFIARGLCAAVSNRLIEAVVFYEAAGRLAEQGGDLGLLAQSQSNLADTLLNSDPRSAIEPAASAAAHARRTGQQRFFAVAMTNLAIAQIELGDWDEASASLSEAIGAAPSVSCINGWLGGLRGDTELAANAAPAIATLRSSEDPQTKSYVGLFDALSALLARDQRTALSHGLSVLELEEAIGIGADAMRFSWPLSVRAARSLGDTEVLEKLLEMLEAHPVGHLAPVLRAGRRLLRALMDLDAGPADRAGGGSSKAQPGAHEALDDAVAYLREVANPYELAHGLIDYAGVLARAEVLARAGAGDADADPAGADPSAAAAALAEARDVTERLRCRPLLERADEAAQALSLAGSRS